MRNNRNPISALILLLACVILVACLPGDTYEVYTFTPEPSLTASPNPTLTHTPAPPTPTISEGDGTPDATPIGGEPTLPPVNLDCPKTYISPQDYHRICVVEVIAATQEFGIDGPTGVDFLPPDVLPIDLTASSNDRCVLRGSSFPDNPTGYRWVNCNHVIAIE